MGWDHDEAYESAEEQRAEFVQDFLDELIEEFKQQNGMAPDALQLKELEEEADYRAPDIEEIVRDNYSSMVDAAYDRFRDEGF